MLLFIYFIGNLYVAILFICDNIYGYKLFASMYVILSGAVKSKLSSIYL